MTIQIYNAALHPATIATSLMGGALLGLMAPEFALSLEAVSGVYVDLLKMIVIPFMVSAVIFSLQRLLREGGATRLLARVALVFAVFAIAATALSAITFHILQPGAATSFSEDERKALAKIVGRDVNASNTSIALKSAEDADPVPSLRDVLGGLVPSNIVSSLAKGEMLKALVFSILFGLAVGHIAARTADALTSSLDTIYQACQRLTRWLNYPLPIALFCMAAHQAAQTGLEPVLAMLNFVIVFFSIAATLCVANIWLLGLRAGCGFGVAARALRDPFALAVATRSSPTCMPMMIAAMAEKLSFARSRIELLVPLSISLLRLGPMVYYACATLFVAQFYDRPVSGGDLALVVAVSVLTGFASAGMSGVVTVSLVGTTCAYLGVPFEAAFVLFVAVEPVCDILRTVLIVIGNCAAVAFSCDKPVVQA